MNERARPTAGGRSGAFLPPPSPNDNLQLNKTFCRGVLDGDAVDESRGFIGPTLTRPLAFFSSFLKKILTGFCQESRSKRLSSPLRPRLPSLGVSSTDLQMRTCLSQTPCGYDPLAPTTWISSFFFFHKTVCEYHLVFFFLWFFFAATIKKHWQAASQFTLLFYSGPKEPILSSLSLR